MKEREYTPDEIDDMRGALQNYVYSMSDKEVIKMYKEVFPE